MVKRTATGATILALVLAGWPAAAQTPSDPRTTSLRDASREFSPGFLRDLTPSTAAAPRVAEDTMAAAPPSLAKRQASSRAQIRRTSKAGRIANRILGGAAGAMLGFMAGGSVGAMVSGKCGCDDPGLTGFIIGAPIGAVVGGIAGVYAAQ